MVLAKYQHMSILELILLVKQHILILCKNLLWLLFDNSKLDTSNISYHYTINCRSRSV